MKDFSTEVAVFEASLAQWIREGRYNETVVIRGTDVLGFFPSLADACRADLPKDCFMRHIGEKALDRATITRALPPKPEIVEEESDDEIAAEIDAAVAEGGAKSLDDVWAELGPKRPILPVVVRSDTGVLVHTEARDYLVEQVNGVWRIYTQTDNSSRCLGSYGAGDRSFRQALTALRRIVKELFRFDFD